MADELKFTFTSYVRFDDNVGDGYMKHYVPIPGDVGKAMEEAGYNHVEGTLAGHKFRRVLHTQADGSHYLRFGKTWLRQAKLDVDDEITIELQPDYDPDRVDIPDELATLLSDDLEVAWEQLPPGKRRTLVYGIERAKQAATKQRRAKAIVDDLRKNLNSGSIMTPPPDF